MNVSAVLVFQNEEKRGVLPLIGSPIYIPHIDLGPGGGNITRFSEMVLECKGLANRDKETPTPSPCVGFGVISGLQEAKIEQGKPSGSSAVRIAQ